MLPITRFRFRSRSKVFGGQFSPASLFAAGEPGTWYDPSDLATLFEDAAGTTPVPSVLERPVGLMLDKSKGLALGPELVTNGDFATDTDWSKGGTWTSSGGKANWGGGGDAFFQQTRTLEVGKILQITFTISGLASGSIGVRQYNDLGTNAGVFSTNGTFSLFLYVSAAAGSVAFRSQSLNAGASISNVSVKVIAGNHAYQTTPADRPTLSARYNLLTKTEQISDAEWVKGSGVTTPTVDTVTVTTADTGVHQAPSNPAATFTAQAEFKFVDADLICFGIVNVANTLFYRFSTNAFSGPAFGSATATMLEDGWVRIRYTYAVGAAGTFGPIVKPQSIGSVRVRNLDFRVTNDGVGLPAYQRVNTATDYDTTGFPPYLYFNGSTRWMQTNTITPGTDKAQVFAGVRKLSDSVTSVIAELSGDAGVNNGVLTLVAATVGRYQWISKGTTLQSTTTPANGADAPITNVLTGLGDVAGDVATARLNGAQVSTNTGDQGTGNYLAYPLYIGRRGGTSLPYNGRIYSLITRFGPNLTAAQITATETYVNTKTRAT